MMSCVGRCLLRNGRVGVINLSQGWEVYSRKQKACVAVSNRTFHVIERECHFLVRTSITPGFFNMDSESEVQSPNGTEVWLNYCPL